MSFGLLLHSGGRILVAGKLARGVQVPIASRGKETTTKAAISLKVFGTLVLRSGIWHLLPP